jgi:carbon-monoxide dehydrogenase small subunit
MTTIALVVNGRPVRADVEPRTHLADFLREQRNLTGTNLGCEQGVCGACTLQIGGAPVRSCIVFAVACDGADVRTIEGFDDDPLMAELRAAFSAEHALQCGYCTPGFVLAAISLLEENPNPSEEEIRTGLEGNLCRCTGYHNIVRAVQAAARAGA